MAGDQSGEAFDFDGSGSQEQPGSGQPGQPDGIRGPSQEAPVSGTPEGQAPITTEAPPAKKAQPQPSLEQTPSRPAPQPEKPRGREVQPPFATEVPESKAQKTTSKAPSRGVREILPKQPTDTSIKARNVQEARIRSMENQSS